jgi:uncharacterized protein (DUF4415 family)
MKKGDNESSAKRSAKAVRETAQRYQSSQAMLSTTLDDVIAMPMRPGSLASRRPPDVMIERAAAADPDAPLLTAAQLAGGRTIMPEGKVAVSLRIDRAIVDAYKATGRGWQTRMNDVLAASIPAVSGDTNETLRALEHSVQQAALYVRQLKRDGDVPASSTKDASARATDAPGNPASSRRKHPK